jgi:hypothetical protein
MFQLDKINRLREGSFKKNINIKFFSKQSFVNKKKINKKTRRKAGKTLGRKLQNPRTNKSPWHKF